MKKRRVIVISCIIAIIVIIAGVFAAMFNLQHISVEVMKNPSIVNAYGSDIGDKIIKSGEFPYGSNTMFTSYKDNEEKIEKAYPFVKVEKIVRRFPNKMTVYVSGRMPEVIVKDEATTNKWYVLDIDMKVLAVLYSASDFENDMYKDLPILRGSDIKNKESGDFLIENSKDVIINILDGIYGKDQTKSSVMSDITMDLENEKYTILLRDSDTTGAKIEINGNDYLKEKVFSAYSLYCNLESDSRFPDKQKMYFIVGKDFVVNTNEKIIMKYDGEEVSPN